MTCNRPEGCSAPNACGAHLMCGYGEPWGAHKAVVCNRQGGCNDPRACESFGSCGTAATPPVASGSVAHGVLLEAAGIVEGARNTTHGDKERSFAAIAGLWNAYMTARKVGGPLTAFDVAQFMVLLKIGRSVQGTPARDHFTDAAGYSAIAAELSHTE